MDETFKAVENLKKSGSPIVNCGGQNIKSLIERSNSNKREKDRIENDINNKRKSYAKKDRQNEGEIKARVMRLKRTEALKKKNESLRNDVDKFKNDMLAECSPGLPATNSLNFAFPLEGAVDFGAAFDVFNKLKGIMTNIQSGVSSMSKTQFTQKHIDFLNEIEFHSTGKNIIGSKVKATYSKTYTVGFLGTSTWDLSLALPSLASPFPLNLDGLKTCTGSEKLENIVTDFGGSIMSLFTYFYGRTKVEKPPPTKIHFSLPSTRDKKYEKKVLKMYDRNFYEKGFEVLENHPIRYTEKMEIAFGFGQFTTTLYSKDGTATEGDQSEWEGLNAGWCKELTPSTDNYGKGVCIDSFAFKFYEDCKPI